MKKERKLPMWTNVDPELVEELDKICRIKYLTRAQCLREAILFYVKDNNKKIPFQYNSLEN